MKRKYAFDQVAEIYDQIRPSYPEELIEKIVKETAIDRRSNILEIGAGTGKATFQMGELGFRVQCIEPGENMAEILKYKCEKFKGINVHVDSFENWENPTGEEFHLIYSAQAFHWIDEKVKYKKCHDILKKDGYLALFWYEPYNPETEIEKKIGRLFSLVAPELLNDGKKKGNFQETLDGRKREMEESGLFKNVKVWDFLVEEELNSEEYMKTLSSYSKFVCLGEKTKEELHKGVREIIEEEGGVKKSGLRFSLFLGKKV